MDRFSPIAPALVQVLVLPVGHIERTRFLNFLDRLQKEAANVELADVKSDDDRLQSLSPSAFPNGSLLFNFTTSPPNEQHQQLSPFELFREPLLVVGVAHGLGGGNEDGKKELRSAAQYLKERHPRVVHRQLLSLEDGEGGEAFKDDGVIHISNSGMAGDISLRAAIRELSARFLLEFATYAKAMQASPSVQTPGIAAKNLPALSLREKDRRSITPSGRQTPPLAEVSSPTSDDSPSRPPSRGVGSPPPTSFAQMPNNIPNGLTRSDSRSSNQSQGERRTRSKDRKSTAAFGSGTSQEKTRNRGKARVGIVIGHIHLMAGQWSEALRTLVEHTTKSRSLSDQLWHAKGLEGIMVCLLLLAWSGLDFQVPSICFTDRPTSAASKRASANLTKDAQPTEAARLASVQKLSNCLPEMSNTILNIYRAGDSSLELPFLAVSEAALRLSKLLAIMYNAKGDLNEKALAQIVQGRPAILNNGPSTIEGDNFPPRTAIAEMVSYSQPGYDENVAIVDRISILAGMAAIYSLLGMNRKKAIVVRAMVENLTTALTQARKLGAAEMGIHPAASLSTETGAGTVLAILDASSGINDLLAEVVDIYGAEMMADSQRPSEEGSERKRPNGQFGNDILKADILRDMVSFCEASPDPYGVIRLATSLMKAARPRAAVDLEPENTFTEILHTDEQARLAAVISRTIGVSKALGLPDVQADYWDPFLVRGVEFKPVTPTQALIERSKLHSASGTADTRTLGNPLLYDPNATRLRNAAIPEKVVLVENEYSECIVTLQNPFSVPLDVESLSLVTEDIKLKTVLRPCTLVPMKIQQVSVSISPSSVGETKITGCRVKLSGCHEQVFPIVQKPWSERPSLLVKDIGQNNRRPGEAPKEPGRSHPEPLTLSATVIGEQPCLSVDSVSIRESSLMLLDGETQSFNITVRNTSPVLATIFETDGTKNVLQLAEDSPASVEIAPGESHAFQFEVVGKAGVSEIRADFYYCCEQSKTEANDYVRKLTVPLDMTVNPALQVQHFDAFPSRMPDNFTLCFDLQNCWIKPLSYRCESIDSANPKEETTQLAPGEMVRKYVQISRSQAMTASQTPEATAHELSKRTLLSWTCDTRTGTIEPFSTAIPLEALAIIRGAPVVLKLSVLEAKDKISITMGAFTTVQVKISNRMDVALPPVFVQLHTRTADHSAYNDRYVAATGALHRIVPPLAPGKDFTMDFVICPLMLGKVDLRATAKPVVVGSGKEGEWLGIENLTINVE